MERLWVFVTVSMAAHFSAGTNWPRFSASCDRLNCPEKRALASHLLLEEKSYIKPTSWPEFTRGSYKSTNTLMLNNANAHMLTQQQGSSLRKWIQSMSCNYQALPTPLIIPAQAILSASTCNFPPGFPALSFAAKIVIGDRLLPCGRGRELVWGSCSYPASTLMSQNWFCPQFHNPAVFVHWCHVFLLCLLRSAVFDCWKSASIFFNTPSTQHMYQ